MPDLDDLLATIERDPRAVVEAASTIAARARADGDLETLTRSLAVLGRARRVLGEIDRAELALEEAVRVAEASGDDELAADAHLGLASVQSFSGRSAEAFAHLDIVERQGSARQRAHAALQRAAVAQRVGHVAEALELYEVALPTLRAEGADLDVARVLANRGVVRVNAGHVTAGMADLVEAAEVFAAIGQDFAAAQAQHNVGWAAMRLGDLPRALAMFDLAQQGFDRLGYPAVEAQVDRAEALLAAGLFTDALHLAESTGGQLAVSGNVSVGAEAWFLAAQAARLDGDPERAYVHAVQARDLFAEQGSQGWWQAAELEILRSRVGSSSQEADLPAELGGMAGPLTAAGNASGAATALALAALAAAELGQAEEAAQWSARCTAQVGTVGVVELQLLTARAQAAAALAAGSRAEARRVILAGLHQVDRHRATLGALDARAHLSGHASSLARVGLGMAIDDGRAAGVLAWMERTRARALVYAPARPPEDGQLADDLAELRVVVAEIRRGELDGSDVGGARQRQGDLEERVRRRDLRTAGVELGHRDGSTKGRGRSSQPVDAAHLRPALAGAVMACVAETGGRLHAVVIGPRRSRYVDLGPAAPVVDASASASTAIGGLASPGGSHAVRAARLALLHASLDTLDRRIVTPLRLGDGRVVLVVPGPLHTTPWRAVPSLAGRAVSIAPSATWWLAAASAEGHGHTEPTAARCLAVAGPRLVEAEREAVEVGACYPGAEVLAGSDATVQAVSAALGRASIAHLATHGSFRHDNPLWSSLELTDGPVTVYDLQRLARTPPLVVLSACDSGVSGVRGGDELLGVSSVLLGLGTRSLVAAIGPLPDHEVTRRGVVAFHRQVATGLDPVEALARASSNRVEEDLGFDPISVCLACFGR